jgi:prepilin-type N-terminal cleavage/methylation domain-containing protein
MKSVANPLRRGFTLVELLMVITIIGMLMGLLIVGVNRALVRARQAQTTVQIDTLDQAMQNAKAQSGLYPPDCSNLSGSASAGGGIAYRQARIVAFFRKAFPKMIVPKGYGNGTTAGSLQFLSQHAWGNSSQITTPSGSGFNLGDLDNLDPAEAIVFFLGGPPAAVGQLVGPAGSQTFGYSLAGWSANASNPFANGGQRGASLYEFQTQRLGDADGDGWPEYYPPTGDIPQPPGTTAMAAANPVPPYVYFDALTYGGLFGFSGGAVAPIAANSYPTGYPFPDGQLSSAMQTQMTALASQWGLALPYVNSQTVNPAYGTGVNDYINPNKFQIISAGADARYSTGASQLFRFFNSAVNYTTADSDNLANFTTGTLQDAAP